VDGCGFAFAVGCIVGAIAIFVTLLWLPDPDTWDDPND
jgi:hypothetical protein